MTRNSRLKKLIRAGMARVSETYMEAREAVLTIRAHMHKLDETYAEAEGWYDDRRTDCTST